MDSKDKDKTIVGYALLIAGLILMFYSIFSAISVFTGGQVPIEIIHNENKQTTDSNKDSTTGINNTSGFDIGQIFQPMYPLFNLIGWLLIAFFILIAGVRVARIGIEMLKASIPDVTIIKSDINNKKEVESDKPIKKEKKGFFRRKSKL